MPKKFVLIDAHSVIFRSYFAFIKNPLKNSKGVNTSGIFGFLNTLEKVKKRLTTDYLCLAFDAPGKTFRDEAYDVLATLAQKLKNKGDVYIVSSDKDLLQMVSDNVYMYDAYKDQIYDREKVIEKFGVPPEKIPEYLALTGDSIDNVPGVPGVGPKRAVEIMQKYATFEEAINTDKRLVAHKESAQLSRKLVTLECQVPLTIRADDLHTQKPDLDKLMPLLLDLEFHSYIKEFSSTHEPTVSVKKIDNLSSITFGNAVGIGFDDTAKIYLCSTPDEVYQIETDHAATVLTDHEKIKIGHDLKRLVKKASLKSPLFDCGVVAWLIDPSKRSYSLEDICLQFLHTYPQITPAHAASLTLNLYAQLSENLDEHGEKNLYYDIEEPLIFVLAKMEQRGIKIDIPYLHTLGEEIQTEIQQREKKIYKIAGRNFNINSPKQLAHILFEELHLKPLKKGKTHYSTNVEVLQQLSAVHPLPHEILNHRELSKIKSTYVDPLIAAAHKNRIHTTFNQTGTTTGRLSSSNPNIQNIPIRSELGKKMRKAFIAEKEFVLISADYSQIELRLLAHIAHDKNLIAAFESGQDIHRHTASLVFGIPEENVDEKQRRMAKVVNYGLIYGMSNYGLAQGLDIPQEEAVQFIESYYSLYADVDHWRAQAISSAEEKGYAETLFNRKRPLPDIHSSNRNLREFSKRAAINTPIQGTAADLMKMAMIDIEKKLNTSTFKSGLLLSIHDELLFEIEEHRVEEAQKMIRESMETVIHLVVPIEVSIGVGKTWAEAH
jgi:DNA polymerase-1